MVVATRQKPRPLVAEPHRFKNLCYPVQGGARVRRYGFGVHHALRLGLRDVPHMNYPG